MPNNRFQAIGGRHKLAVLFSILLCAALASATLPARAQTPPPPAYEYNAPKELNVMISNIVLYPDPLLSQVLAAATFPDEIPDAAQWAEGHRHLSGKDLAQAITDDHLPWDGSVQALLPFPSVLDMMARDITWTTALGGAFLAQRGDLMDAMQEMRHRASAYGYLRSDAHVIVTSGIYVQILPTNPAIIPVPDYDSAAVFSEPPSWLGKNHAVAFGDSVKLGPAFRPWGWGISKFFWADHDVTTHRRAPRYDPEDRQEKHQLSPLPNSQGQESPQGKKNIPPPSTTPSLNQKPCNTCNPT